MKSEIQATPDLRKLGELIDGIEVAMLTTHAADGSMVSRPLQTLEFDHSGELVFFTAADRRKIDDLQANPDVNIAYANPGRQSYVSVRGTASVDRDRATIDKLWSPVQKIFFPGARTIRISSSCVFAYATPRTGSRPATSSRARSISPRAC